MACRSRVGGWMPLLPTGLRNMPGRSTLCPFQHFTEDCKVWHHQRCLFSHYQESILELEVFFVQSVLWGIWWRREVLDHPERAERGEPSGPRKRDNGPWTEGARHTCLWGSPQPDQVSEYQEKSEHFEEYFSLWHTCVWGSPHGEGEMLIRLIWHNLSEWCVLHLKEHSIAMHCITVFTFQ